MTCIKYVRDLRIPVYVYKELWPDRRETTICLREKRTDEFYTKKCNRNINYDIHEQDVPRQSIRIYTQITIPIFV